MKSLSSLERNVIECIGNQKMTYAEVQYQSGLHENVCFNILQALLIRGLLKYEGSKYSINESISSVVIDEVNGHAAKDAEYMELVESVIVNRLDRCFKLKKIAIAQEDETMLLALLSNLESFLMEAHRKSEKYVPMKERKVVFWGMGEIQKMMGVIATGRSV